MKVEQIVKKYLEEHGYDGLYNDSEECGCTLAFLFPCDNPGCYTCMAGYAAKNDEGVEIIQGDPIHKSFVCMTCQKEIEIEKLIFSAAFGIDSKKTFCSIKCLSDYLDKEGLIF